MDWTAAGTIIAAVTLAATGAGAVLRQRANRSAQEPRIVFSDLYFSGPEDSRRPSYRYAISVRLTNVGGGPALHLHWGFADPEKTLYAEMIHRAALPPHDSTDDSSGIRGEQQEDDPTEKEARAFYERCLAFAECWDSRGDHYIFFPFGGGRAADPHGGPEALRERMSQFPSRDEARRALGFGLGTFRPGSGRSDSPDREE